MRYLFGDYVLDPARREFRRGDREVHIEPQVFDLLLHLIRNHERVVSRDELLSAVWHGRVVSESTLDSRINAARRAVGDSGRRQRFIRTVARRGLRFVGSVELQPSAPESLAAQAGTSPAGGGTPAGGPPKHGAEVRRDREPSTVFLAAGPVNEAAADATLSEYREVVSGFIGAHGGQVLEDRAAGITAGFPDAAGAVRAAVDFQRELTARNAPVAEAGRVQFRVGIDVGDGSATDGVGTAAALASAAEPGGICISADAREQLDRAAGLPIIELRRRDAPDAAEFIWAYTVSSRAPTAVGTDNADRDKPAVAVLPFQNMSGDREQEYFSDGITEDILTALSRYRSLLVIARTSTFTFKGHGADVRRVGADLGADYVVEGSVRRIGPRVRITVQLVETGDGRHIWAERYDRNLADIFEVQDEITATIAARIEPEVSTVERLRAERKPPQSLRAWDVFHLGMNRFYKATKGDNLEAQRLLQRATELDPQLAQAYAWLSYSIILSMVYFDAEPDDTRLAEALAMARQGVQLDDRDALIRFMYGRALLARRSYADALAEMRTAVELNPGLAVAYCGLADSLAYDGRFREAFPYFQKAIDIGPYDPQRWAFYAYRSLAHLFAGELEQTVEWAQKATRIPNCHYWPFAHRVAALGHLRDREALQTAVAELLARKPDFSCRLARGRLFYLKDGAQLDTYVEGLRRAGMPER